MKRMTILLIAALALACQAATAEERAWIEESNKHAQILLEVLAKYAPEGAAQVGVEGHDGEVFDLKPQFSERQEADLQAALAKLEQARATATDPRVRQDLDILIDAARKQHDTLVLTRRLMLPYFDLTLAIYNGFQNLLDARVPKERQKNALIRLHRYVGAERGYEPITTLARARYEEAAGNAALVGPWVVEAGQHLENQKRYVDGIRDLL